MYFKLDIFFSENNLIYYHRLIYTKQSLYQNKKGVNEIDI